MAENFNIVIQQSNLTVMTHYEANPKDAQRYQSKASLEENLVRQLMAQYEYYRKQLLTFDKAEELGTIIRRAMEQTDNAPILSKEVTIDILKEL